MGKRMKIAVSTTCSDGYVIFLEHFIKSILRNNPRFGKDFIVFCDPRLSINNRNKLKELYRHFKFHDVQYHVYQNHRKAHMKYYSIESFSLINYDRVIYWGADMLCIGKLGSLWTTAKKVTGISMTKEKRRSDNDMPYNNGGMIIGKKYLNLDAYRKLLGYDNMHPPYNLTDQKLYNRFFAGKIKEIDMKFNTLTSETEFIPFKKILILHYIHKPTVKHSITQLNTYDDRLYSLWREYD